MAAKSDGTRRRQFYSVGMTPDEYAVLKRNAAQAGMSIAAWLRVRGLTRAIIIADDGNGFVDRMIAFRERSGGHHPVGESR